MVSSPGGGGGGGLMFLALKWDIYLTIPSKPPIVSLSVQAELIQIGSLSFINFHLHIPSNILKIKLCCVSDGQENGGVKSSINKREETNPT